MTDKILYYYGEGILASEEGREKSLISYLKKEPPRFCGKFKWLREEKDKDKEKKIQEIISKIIKLEKQKERDMDFYKADRKLTQMVNIAMAVKRPLLLTGDAGCGKSDLAYSIAWELGLGEVLHWTIRSRSTVKEGLYHYDAIGRLQKIQELELMKKADESFVPDLKTVAIENFITLGPLGTALADQRMPRVLLIDEIDKSDIDFPNDLLHELDQFCFSIPELAFYQNESDKNKENKGINLKTCDMKMLEVSSHNGKILGGIPPVVIITSNQEIDLSKAFIRRCIPHKVEHPNEETKIEILRKVYYKNEKDDKKCFNIEQNIKNEIMKINEILNTKTINNSISRLLDYFLCYPELSKENKEEFIKSFFTNDTL